MKKKQLYMVDSTIDINHYTIHVYVIGIKREAGWVIQVPI